MSGGETLQRVVAGVGGLSERPSTDSALLDTAVQVYISSLALLKMLKHGRAGVPMEVMGLMLGEFVDDYTVRVVDVFAMPQSVDINTQQSFEAISQRVVAVVVDPIQSVKGKVVIDAFRLINPQTMVFDLEPRQTTSNLGHLNKPSMTKKRMIDTAAPFHFVKEVVCRFGGTVDWKANRGRSMERINLAERLGHASGQRNCRSLLENGKSLINFQRQIMNERRTRENRTKREEQRH
ncbi:hypothetical protein K1719_030153 [Acacia pycnantha]|nr:hypothetical protein K1719_030153 [Acacia pycnantha]